MSISRKCLRAMRESAIVICIILQTLPVIAQDFDIQGTIVSSKTQERLAYANVRVKNRQIGVSANAEGEYRIAASKGDTLVFSYLGYIDKERCVTDNPHVDMSLDEENLSIEGANIIGSTKPISLQSDRLVVNVSALDPAGRQLSDILEQVPLVQVSNGEISIFGKESTDIYVNDKKISLSGDAIINYLNSIPLDRIMTIEVMATPSPAYDLNGNAGIIFLNVSRSRQATNGSLKVGGIINHYASGSGIAQLSYTRERFGFDGTLVNSRYDHLNKSEYYSKFASEHVCTYNPKKWRASDFFALLSFGYDIGARGRLSFSLQIPFENKETVEDIENKTEYIGPASNELDSTMISNGTTKKRTSLWDANLIYEHTVSEKLSLKAGVGYISNEVVNERAWNSNMVVKSSSSDVEIFATMGHLDYQIFTPRLDAYGSLGGYAWTAGYKLSCSKTNSNNEFFNVCEGATEKENSLSDKFDYTEIINSAYITVGRSFKRFSAKIGTRLEFFQSTGNSISMNQKVRNDDMRVFPSISFSYRPDDGNSIAFNYSDRFDWPAYQYLDPFRWYISKYDFAEGNPFLKPARIRNSEIAYQHGTWLNVRFYHMSTTDGISRLVVLDPDDIRNQIQETGNFLDNSSFGISLFCSMKYLKILESSLSANVEHSSFSANVDEFKDASGFNATVMFNTRMKAGKNVTLSCKLADQLPGIYNYRDRKNTFQTDISASFFMDDGHIELQLSANDIFGTATSRYHYDSNGVEQSYNNYRDLRQVKIMALWRFGKSGKSIGTGYKANGEEMKRL